MRYQKIHSQIWHDEKFMQLSPEAQRLFLYFLSSPHSNSIGLYVIHKMYVCADLQITVQQLKKPFEELIKNGLIMYDEAVNLILIVNHLKHNKIENEKQAIGMAKIVAILPKSHIIQDVIIQLPKHYHKPLVKALKELYAIPEEKEEEEKKEKEEFKPWPSEDMWLFNLIQEQTIFTDPQKEYLSDHEWWEDLDELLSSIDEDFLKKQFLKMKVWKKDNKQRWPTAKGIGRFVRTWLERAKEDERKKSYGNRR